MREPNWLILLIVVAVIFVGGILFGSIGKAALRNEASAWRRTAAENAQLIEVEKGRYRRAAVELDGAREARAVLEERNADLTRELRRSRAEVRSLQDMVVTVPPDTVVVTATDTVTVEGQTRVDFVLPFDVGEVRGHTRTPPPHAEGILLLNPIPIQVVTSELPDGSWQTDVTLQPPFELGKLDTFTNPRRPSWWERHDFKVGLGLGVVAVLLIMSAAGG